MNRPRHQNSEGEDLLQLVENAGWVVSKAKKYFKVQCNCGEHQRWVHLTPSNPNYWRNAQKWFERRECWNSD